MDKKSKPEHFCLFCNLPVDDEVLSHTSEEVCMGALMKTVEVQAFIISNILTWLCGRKALTNCEYLYKLLQGEAISQSQLAYLERYKKWLERKEHE